MERAWSAPHQSHPMTSTPTAGYRMRIAISSPEIEARIRDVFASRGLDVVLGDLPPTFEVTVLPGSGAAPAATAVGDALHQLVGTPPVRRAEPPSARYRLSLAAATRDAGPTPVRHGGAGVADLSPREAQVMACVARGLRNTEIADELGVTVKTVKNHVNRIFGKLGADGRVEAVLMWQAARAVRPASAATGASTSTDPQAGARRRPLTRRRPRATVAPV